jgi:electron transport complex protein RnfG
MNGGLKSGLVLLVLGIICGTLLAVVNYFTAPEIFAIEEKAKADALEVFYDLKDYDLTIFEYENDAVSAIYVLEANDTIEALVYLVEATGNNGPVQMLIAVNSDFSIEGYTVVNHKEDPGFGAEIVDNDFGVTSVTDLSGFDTVAGSTITSDAIEECFLIISERAGTDFGGGLDD